MSNEKRIEPLTAAEIAEAGRMAEVATPGPWVAWSQEGPDRKAGTGHLESVCRHVGDVTSEEHECVSYARGEDEGRACANGYFIAASRALVPRLIATIAARDAEITRLGHLVSEREASANLARKQAGEWQKTVGAGLRAEAQFRAERDAALAELARVRAERDEASAYVKALLESQERLAAETEAAIARAEAAEKREAKLREALTEAANALSDAKKGAPLVAARLAEECARAALADAPETAKGKDQ